MPISELQPTPQEETENAISESNAASTATDAPASSDPEASRFRDNMAAEHESHNENTAEVTEDSGSMAQEQDSVSNALRSAAAGAGAAMGEQSSGFDRQRRDRADRGDRGDRGDRMDRERERDREPASPKPTIHVGNLFFDVTENDLAKEFSRFGEIQNTRLIRDARGLSKG